MRDTENPAAYAERWAGAPVKPLPEREGDHRGLLILALAVMMIGGLTVFSPVVSRDASRDAAAPSNRPPAPPVGLGSGLLAKLLPGGQSVTVRQDFRSVRNDWKDLQPGPTWIHEAEVVRPGRLRIWARSEGLTDYDFEFLGQIQRKSMDWAFRAADGKNYYAGKLAIVRAGPAENAFLIRYAVIDGKRLDRVELPLPVTLGRNIDYRVRVSVRGQQFLTSVDGVQVGSWSDGRMSRGGVGFFSDEGESSMLKWTQLSERDSMVGKALSYFSFFTIHPGIRQE